MNRKLINIILVVLFLNFVYTLFIINIENAIQKEIFVFNDEFGNNLNFYKNKYLNNDIVGKIKINGTDINALLVKTNNNKYYLNHSITKEEDEKGTLFVDYRTDLNSKRINIYGHNSTKYELVFNELVKYKSKEFYEKNKVIEIWTGSKINYYEIFSIQIVNNNSLHMDINSENYISQFNNSIHKNDSIATNEDEILVLQTCDNVIKNTYLLIVAKKV